MRRLPHGYTNQTTADQATVVKRYQGPDAAARLARERELLADLAGVLPVPPLLGAGDESLILGFVAGEPGQELMDAGDPEAVLRACGEVLRRIHARPSVLGAGTLVHGDFGPNNLLLDPETYAVAAVVDWEFAHLGDPIEDLAWCEWIVRMHHPDRVGALGAFFEGYGAFVPRWPERRAAMVDRCLGLREFCRRWDPDGPAVAEWQRRAEVTAGW
ncbi:phosphotransferase [Glycomyces sp. NPDC049804]|uniref:phosphotransferase family protein n=1 Tax=Glycomyces sp. NPDC049804 TaxID=3154363 RepID=UPI003440C6DC